MAAMTTRERTLGLATAAVLGGALLWTVAIGPTIARYRELTLELDELTAQVDQQLRRNRRDRSYRARLKELEGRLAESDDAAFIKQLEHGIQQCGMVIQASTRGGTERKPKSGYEIRSFTLRLEGNLTSVARLLDLFQREQQFLRIHSIAFAIDRHGKHGANLVLSTLVALREEGS
jgi:hypothetical protein